MDDADWTHWLAGPFRGRKIILGYRVVAGATKAVESLTGWGAQPPLVIGVGRGPGPVPDPNSYELHQLRADPPRTMTEEVRRVSAWSADPARANDCTARFPFRRNATQRGVNARPLGRVYESVPSACWSSADR